MKIYAYKQHTDKEVLVAIRHDSISSTTSAVKGIVKKQKSSVEGIVKNMIPRSNHPKKHSKPID